MPTREMIKLALLGKSIQILALITDCITTSNLIEIICSLDHPQSLRYLNSNSSCLSIEEFVQSLPAVQFGGLQEMEYYYVDYLSLNDPTFSIILNLCRLFAQRLQEISTHRSKNFKLSITTLFGKNIDNWNQMVASVKKESDEKFLVCSSKGDIGYIGYNIEMCFNI
jgi:hypothetical protein